MGIIDDFTLTAVMIIYPNGMVDGMPINDNNYHMYYFLELLEKSPYFFKTVKDNYINLTDKKGNLSDISTYELDESLTKLGIIVVRNINIVDINEDKNFINKQFPIYLFSFPKKLSLEQKSIMSSLLTKYNLQDSMYCYNSGEEIEELEYYDIDNFLNGIKTLY